MFPLGGDGDIATAAPTSGGIREIDIDDDEDDLDELEETWDERLWGWSSHLVPLYHNTYNGGVLGFGLR